MTNYEKIAALCQALGRPESTPGALSCPVHQGQPGGLHFHCNETVPGGFHIICTYPRCGFSGSVLELAAAAKHCSLQEASQLFTPGNPLYGLFFITSGNDGADKDFVKHEVLRIEDHRRAAEYLASCKSAFMDNGVARQFLVGKGISEDLLQKLGCCSPVTNSPSRLANCMPTKIMDRFVMLPYLSAGIATDISIYDIRDGSRTQHQLEKRSRGIFLSEFLPRTAVPAVTVCRDEMDAMVLLSKISDVGAAGINPVSVMDPAAVLQLPGLAAVNLISHADSRATLSHVMDYLRLSPGLKVSMVELPGALNMMSSTKLRRIFEASVEGWTWLAARINAIGRDDGMAALEAQLAALGLARPEKSMILKRLEALGITNMMLIDEVRNARPACLVRDCCGASIKRTFSGYEQITPYSRTLSNFILIVNYFTGEKGGDKTMAATIKTDRPGCPGYDITVPVKALMTRDGGKLMHIVWNRLTELGVKFNMQAANSADVDWFTIIRMFDDAEYKEQSRIIGIDGSSIRYPAMKINLASGTIAGADVLPNLPDIVTQTYGRLSDCGLVSADDTVVKLHARRDDAIDSFLGLMGHVLHETARAARPSYKPRHLIIPTAAPESLTDTMLGQLSAMLGGSPAIRTVPADLDAQEQFFTESQKLGGLPTLCKSLDTVSGLVKQLNLASGSMILLYPAALLPDNITRSNSYYMSEILDKDHCELSPEVLDALRACWGPMLAATYAAGLNSELPARAWMQKFCGGPPADYLFTQEPFNNGSSDDYAQFLELLAHLVEIREITLASAEAQFNHKHRKATDVGYYRGSKVRVSKRLLFDAMKRHGADLQWETVSALMSANGNWPPGRCFHKIIDLATWNTLTRKNYGLRLLTNEDLNMKTA